MAGTVQYYNLTGGLNTVQSIGTINQSPKRTESPDMQNVEYYKLGGLKSMEGNTQLANTLPASISLGYEYVYKNEKYLIVTTTDGTVYKYNKIQNVFDEIYKFPTPTARHSICTFNNGIVISNGVDDLVFYQYQRREQLTGTVSIEEGTSSVTGIDTQFKAELTHGDYILIGDNTYKVDTVESDTQLTIDGVAEVTVEGSSFYLGELSELNAVYTNTAEEEDSVNKPVRGLALNSYQGRLFVGGDDGILYYSEVGLIHGWDNQYGAGAIPSFYDDNSDFTALGLWDKYLVICKRERSYLLDGTDANDANWVLQPYSDYTCDSQQSWIVANNAFIVYSRVAGGIYPLLQRTIYNPNYQGTDLSIKIRDSFEYVNQAKYDNIYPVYHPKKAYIMFYIPLLTGNGSNNCFIYDIRTKTWLLRKVPQEVTIAFRWNDEIYIGTKDGKILREFNGLTFDGEAIEWYWKSPWFSFGQGSNYLSSREFRINLAEEGTNRFRIRNRRDGKDVYDTRQIKNSSGAFSGLVWDLGYNRADLDSSYKTTRQVYSVSDGTNTYYTLVAGEENRLVPYGSKLYLDKDLTEPAGFAGINSIFVAGTVGDTEGAIAIESQEQTAYAWSCSAPEYRKFSNGTEYVWITWLEYDLKENSSCLYSTEDDKENATRTTITKIIRQDDGKITATIDNKEIADLEYIADDGSVGYSVLTREPTITEGISVWTGLINNSFIGVGLKNGNILFVENNQEVTPISTGTSTYKTYNYEIQEPVNYLFTGESTEEPDPLAITPPTEEEYNIESLTETVWDEDSWVILSHKIKRFPLATQYFNTLQVEFYGNDANEGMSIYGFEIDGIQLEEVPW